MVISKEDLYKFFEEVSSGAFTAYTPENVITVEDNPLADDEEDEYCEF